MPDPGARGAQGPAPLFTAVRNAIAASPAGGPFDIDVLTEPLLRLLDWLDSQPANAWTYSRWRVAQVLARAARAWLEAGPELWRDPKLWTSERLEHVQRLVEVVEQDWDCPRERPAPRVVPAPPRDAVAGLPVDRLAVALGFVDRHGEPDMRSLQLALEGLAPWPEVVTVPATHDGDWPLCCGEFRSLLDQLKKSVRGARLGSNIEYEQHTRNL